MFSSGSSLDIQNAFSCIMFNFFIGLVCHSLVCHILYMIINIVLLSFLDKFLLFMGQSAPQSVFHIGVERVHAPAHVCVLLPSCNLADIPDVQ